MPTKYQAFKVDNDLCNDAKAAAKSAVPSATDDQAERAVNLAEQLASNDRTPRAKSREAFKAETTERLRAIVEIEPKHSDLWERLKRAAQNICKTKNLSEAEAEQCIDEAMDLVYRDFVLDESKLNTPNKSNALRFAYLLLEQTLEKFRKKKRGVQEVLSLSLNSIVKDTKGSTQLSAVEAVMSTVSLDYIESKLQADQERELFQHLIANKGEPNYQEIQAQFDILYSNARQRVLRLRNKVIDILRTCEGYEHLEENR